LVVNESFRKWAPAALSAALAVALYAITLAGSLNIYDDAIQILVDPRTRDPKLWGQFWTQQWLFNAVDNLYRPLVSQSLGLQWWLNGDRPWAFHLVNLLLHAGVCALVADLGRRLVNRRVGLIAGLLFACHPVHSEAVAEIVGRAELACAIGVIGALVLFLKQPMTYRRAVAIFVLAAVAMLSKEQGFLLPFLLAALIPVRRKLFPDPQMNERKPVQTVFILVCYLACGLILLREYPLHLKFDWDRSFLDFTQQPLKLSRAPDRWLIPVALVGRYFQILVVPAKLSIDYGLDVIGSTIRLSDPYIWLGAAVILAGFFATTVAALRRQWVVLFCLIGMGITYAPASNLVMIAAIFGERLMYLPSAFFLLLVAMMIARIPIRAGAIVVTVLVLLGCVRTWTYIEKWHDRNSFYEYSFAQQPESVKLALLVSWVDYEQGRLDQAEEILAREILRHRDYAELWSRSATVAEARGDWQTAVEDWKRAFDLQPSMAAEAKMLNARQMLEKQRAATRTAATAQ
jgi:protein O-mannosyl-transferase